MKKLIVFDLDGTLADSKSPLPDKMALLLDNLLSKYRVCVMSGGTITQFENQLLSNLKADPVRLKQLHLMPTCGTRYYIYDTEKGWTKIYAEDIADVDKKRISKAINQGVDHFNLREEKVWGELIEDRGSQVTYSALGQDIVTVLGEEGVKMKKAWESIF